LVLVRDTTTEPHRTTAAHRTTAPKEGGEKQFSRRRAADPCRIFVLLGRAHVPHREQLLM